LRKKKFKQFNLLQTNKMEFFLKGIPGQPSIKLQAVNLNSDEVNIFDLINDQISSVFNLSQNEFYLTSTQGVILSAKSSLQNRDTLCLCPKVLGGKGGFGSLLRAFGKQITLSTNKEVNFCTFIFIF